jgi:hypothetical protein
VFLTGPQAWPGHISQSCRRRSGTRRRCRLRHGPGQGLPDGIVPLGIGVLQECLPEGRDEVSRLLLAAVKAASTPGQ